MKKKWFLAPTLETNSVILSEKPKELERSRGVVRALGERRGVQVGNGFQEGIDFLADSTHF